MTKLRPWIYFALAGLGLGLSLWSLGFARSQDAAKASLWWFTLGSSVLALGQSLSARTAARGWLLLCLVFGLDSAVQGLVRGFFGALPQPSVIAEALANTTVTESWGFVLEQRWPIAKSGLYALAWLASHAAGRGTPMRVGDIAILGSMITTRFPKPGEHWRFALDGFPALDLRIDP